jgi:hypothetical protein
LLRTLREEQIYSLLKKRMQRKTFRPKRGEGTGNCRKLHDQGHHDLHPLTDIIRVIKSRRKRWVGHVACIGGEEKCTNDKETRSKETIWKTEAQM